MINKKPFTTLIIFETVHDRFLAKIKSKNSKTIWITSESYKNRTGVVNACRYTCKPDVIKIDLPNRHWKFIAKLELMLDKLWG